ncbi:MAG: hypothetical protein ACOH2J_03795 [Allorhizobium sp.]
MFKIAKASLAVPFAPGSLEANESDTSLMMQFCVPEGWIGDLANGVIKLGRRTTALHGLESSECGLLSMMRCYEPDDRAHILELFEVAAAASSSFCYSTTIIMASGQRQPVFCVGESNGLETKHSGSMIGIFMFPRFKLPQRADLDGHI